MGGLFVFVYHEMAIQECEFIDHGLFGEAEQSFAELLEAIDNGPGTKLFDDLVQANIIDKDFKLPGNYFKEPPYETEHFTKQDLIDRANSIINMFPHLSILEEIEKKNHG